MNSATVTITRDEGYFSKRTRLDWLFALIVAAGGTNALLRYGSGLDSVALKTDARGFIPGDLASFRTAVAGIYAIGDLIEGAMLAHKASEEGIALIEMLAGQKPRVNYNTIPSVIDTASEVASFGQTEEALKSACVPYKAGCFPFAASARAKAKAHTSGLVKVLAHASTDEILGVHIIGPEAGSLIHESRRGDGL